MEKAPVIGITCDRCDIAIYRLGLPCPGVLRNVRGLLRSTPCKGEKMWERHEVHPR